jgi:hypothetical protein
MSHPLAPTVTHPAQTTHLLATVTRLQAVMVHRQVTVIVTHPPAIVTHPPATVARPPVTVTRPQVAVTHLLMAQAAAIRPIPIAQIRILKGKSDLDLRRRRKLLLSAT